MSSNNTNHNNSASSGTVVCTPKPNSKLNKAEGYMAACQGGVLQVTMGMFFDGTGNNKENVKQGFGVFDSTSYGNETSNVARAWEFYKGALNGVILKNNTEVDSNNGGNFNIYVEGIGTNNGAKDDDWLGYALGIHGRSGIRSRVRLGTRKAAEAIMTMEDVKKTINTINKIEVTFDVFGFSRGAAAARHFLSLNTEPHSPIDDPLFDFNSYFEYNINKLFEGERKIEIEIIWRFIGLYETVSSHGGDFEDDVGELGLDAISNAKFVAQIVAEDEYRKNFSLTTIDSAKNNGFTINLPGVHSDIGGGYKEEIRHGSEHLQEDKLILYRTPEFETDDVYATAESLKIAKKVKNWFFDQGWYREQKGNNFDQLEIEDNVFALEIDHYRIIGSRKYVSSTYSHIPLHIMTDLASVNEVIFDTNGLKGKYPVKSDPFLKKVFDSFDGKKLNVSSWDLKKLRYEYLHWSSQFYTIKKLVKSIGHSPRINDQKEHPQFERNIIQG
ncbi:phospholipase effector Tle1 domain-containing protein [Aquimarina sp. SS2-1]|uniref:phospholipase effector Tle1 domain-containing protein n=1 Tax=Aquimarina besae TaxID=3342247 RepID=UPI00366E6E30